MVVQRQVRDRFEHTLGFNNMVFVFLWGMMSLKVGTNSSIVSIQVYEMRWAIAEYLEDGDLSDM